MRTITRTAFATSGIAAAAVALAACGTPTIAKTPASAPAASAAATTAPAPAATAPAAPATSAAPVTTGPLGTTFTVTTQNDNGGAVEYTVTAVKVDQHAALAPYETTQNPGDHIAAVEFKITGMTGQESDDADSDAEAIGGDTTEYRSSFGLSSHPDFNDGEFEVSPGQTVSGWVTFEIPSGQRVASVQWSAGFDGPAATWTLGS